MGFFISSKKLFSLSLLLAIAFPVAVFASMTSTNYQIQWDSIGVGGGETSSSASYSLRDSIGNFGVGNSTSTTYQVNSGYRTGVYDPVASFQVHGQTQSTQVAATVLSGTTVTITSVSGFAVGNWIAVIQNEGASQVAEVGKITSVGATTLTVDFWSTGGSTPSIDGTNDYVYALTSTSTGFSLVTSSAVSTAIVAWEVSSDVAQGYSVYANEDQDLSYGARTIPGVSDGTVSAGSAEYGARSSDSSLSLSIFDTVDTAFTTTFAQVGSRASNALKSRDFLTLKVSAASDTHSGSYDQTLGIVYVGDY